MKTLTDTTEILIETWDDPGDYPSNAGSGPLASYDYLAGIEGEIEVQLTWSEYIDFCATLNCESLQFWMDEVYDYEYPDGILSATWEYKVDRIERFGFLWLNKRVTITLWAEEVEEDPDYEGEDPPDEPPDDY